MSQTTMKKIAEDDGISFLIFYEILVPNTDTKQ